MMQQRRRASRGAAPASTLPGLAPARAGGALDEQAAEALRMRRVRSLVYRLGAVRFTALITLFAVGASLAITLIVDALFPPPPQMVAFTLGLTVLIPLLVAPVVAWFIVRLMFEAEHARRVAERLAVTDPLTRAFNRRHFFEVGERTLAQAHGQREALSVLLLDIDNFKAVNDRHGHAVGDRVLTQVAQACTDEMREHDLLARFGGEEFAVLLPATGLVEAASVAERLRLAVELLAVTGADDAAVRPTVSIGVATSRLGHAPTLDALLATADQAMYAAKRGGRNRVITEAAARG